MKRFYRRELSSTGGIDEEATISIESDAVTVAVRDITSRSKGKPVRIPLKLCKGESPELEARAQAMKLQAEGFTFTRDDGAVSSTDNQAMLYVIVRKGDIPAVIDYVTGYELPPGVAVNRLPGGGVRVRDQSSQELLLVAGQDSSSILLMNSPIVAVAMLLCHEGLAVLAHETAPGPAGTRAVEPSALYGLAQTIDKGLNEFLKAKGITPPGVVNTQAVTRAILL